MPPSDEVYLLAVIPPERYGAAWDMFSDLLQAAFTAARNTDPQTQRLKAYMGLTQLWCVVRLNPLTPVGVYFTEIVERGGKRIMTGHTMSGRDLRRWAHLAQSAVETEARAHDCAAVWIMGRRGLLRIYDGYSIVGDARPGEMLFEKVLI
jgi:hypothetical protein